jgi:hypothetical protein
MLGQVLLLLAGIAILHGLSFQLNVDAIVD